MGQERKGSCSTPDDEEFANCSEESTAEISSGTALDGPYGGGMLWVDGVKALMLQVSSEKMEGEGERREEWGAEEEERSKICCRNREISSGGEEEETAAVGRVHVDEVHAFPSQLLGMEWSILEG